jgi:hypothetical protein
MPIQSTPIQSSESGLPLSAHPPLALDQFMRQSGWSNATLWRYRKRGWLNVITIAGRHYVTREAIAEFNRRAAAGEFAGKVANPSEYRTDTNKKGGGN